MYNIEEIHAMTPEQQKALQNQLGRRIITRLVLPKLAIVVALMTARRYVNRSYQSSVTEH